MYAVKYKPAARSWSTEESDSGHPTCPTSPCWPMGANKPRRTMLPAPATMGARKAGWENRVGPRRPPGRDSAAATKNPAATALTTMVPHTSNRSLTPLPTEWGEIRSGTVPNMVCTEASSATA